MTKTKNDVPIISTRNAEPVPTRSWFMENDGSGKKQQNAEADAALSGSPRIILFESSYARMILFLLYLYLYFIFYIFIFLYFYIFIFLYFYIFIFLYFYIFIFYILYFYILFYSSIINFMINSNYYPLF